MGEFHQLFEPTPPFRPNTTQEEKVQGPEGPRSQECHILQQDPRRLSFVESANLLSSCRLTLLKLSVPLHPSRMLTAALRVSSLVALSSMGSSSLSENRDTVFERLGRDSLCRQPSPFLHFRTLLRRFGWSYWIYPRQERKLVRRHGFGEFHRNVCWIHNGQNHQRFPESSFLDTLRSSP